MIRAWQFHEARNKFSEVVEEATRSGPQMIAKRGVETAVVLSCADYRQLMATQQKLSTFFRESPLAETPLDPRREKSAARPEPAL